jgi:spore coat protein H
MRSCSQLMLPSLVWLAFAASASAQTPAPGPATADDLFSLERVHDVHVFMSSRDFHELLERYEENVFFPADLQWNGLRIRNVGVRVRGRASRVQGKPGLQVDFSRYVREQRFLGLDSLVLDNRWQDPALFREQVAMAFFERMGIAAPRESFCRLYVNHTFYGLYAIVEAIDPSFIERRFDDHDGYLFEYQNESPFYGEYLGDDLAPYRTFFDPRSRRLDPPVQLYAPIRDLFRAVNHTDDALWRADVERYLDLDQLVTYVAVETFLAEPDGFLGGVGMANFYVHRRAGGVQHRLVPWDKDLSFSHPASHLFRNAHENEIFRRLLAYEDLLALYLQRLEECARAATGRYWLLREITRTARLVAEAAYADDRKAYTNEDFDAAVEYLREFARLRPAFVLREVAALREAFGGD